jgi:endonuclease YncB( thermonuclease family)
MGCFSSKYGISNKQIKCLQSLTHEETVDFSFQGITTWAKVVDVYDGDTYRILFFLNKKDKYPIKIKIRASGYNSPEMYPPKSHNNRSLEMKKAFFARNRLIQLITDCQIDVKREYSKNEIKNILKKNNKFVRVSLLGFDKFGRVLANCYTSGKLINQLMIDEKHGIKYNGGVRVDLMSPEGVRDKNELTI